jgi:hypothetical protein
MNSKVSRGSKHPEFEIGDSLSAHSITKRSELTGIAPIGEPKAENPNIATSVESEDSAGRGMASPKKESSQTDSSSARPKLQDPSKIIWRSLMLEP